MTGPALARQTVEPSNLRRRDAHGRTWRWHPAVATSTRDQPSSERASISAAQGGDRTAFRDLYLANAPEVYRYAVRRVAHHEAEDVVAETFARAWRGLHGYQDQGRPFVAWLLRICQNVLLTRARRDRHQPVIDLVQRIRVATPDEPQAARRSMMPSSDYRTVSDRSSSSGSWRTSRPRRSACGWTSLRTRCAH